LSAFRKRDTLLRPLNNPLLHEATEQGKEAVVLDMNSVSFRDLGLELARRGNPRLCASTQRRYNQILVGHRGWLVASSGSSFGGGLIELAWSRHEDRGRDWAVRANGKSGEDALSDLQFLVFRVNLLSVVGKLRAPSADRWEIRFHARSSLLHLGRNADRSSIVSSHRSGRVWRPLHFATAGATWEAALFGLMSALAGFGHASASGDWPGSAIALNLAAWPVEAFDKAELDTGSTAVSKTIGIEMVAAFAACAEGVPPSAAITFTWRRTWSVASAGNRS
jgi:hypothetical protein